MTPSTELNNTNTIKIIKNIYSTNKTPIVEDSESLQMIGEQLQQTTFLGLEIENEQTHKFNRLESSSFNDEFRQTAIFLYPTQKQVEIYSRLEQLKHVSKIKSKTYSFDDLYAIAKTNLINNKNNKSAIAFFIANSEMNDIGIKITDELIVKAYEISTPDLNFKSATTILSENPEAHPELSLLQAKLQALCDSQKGIDGIYVFEGWYKHNFQSKQTKIVIDSSKRIKSTTLNEISQLQIEYIEYLTKKYETLNTIETYTSKDLATTFLSQNKLSLNEPLIKNHD